MDQKSYENWKSDGEKNGWVMPTAPYWKRLLIVRRLRAVILSWKIESHYRNGIGALGAFRSGYDDWVVWGIAHGFERPTHPSDEGGRDA